MSSFPYCQIISNDSYVSVNGSDIYLSNLGRWRRRIHRDSHGGDFRFSFLPCLPLPFLLGLLLDLILVGIIKLIFRRARPCPLNVTPPYPLTTTRFPPETPHASSSSLHRFTSSLALRRIWSPELLFLRRVGQGGSRRCERRGFGGCLGVGNSDRRLEDSLRETLRPRCCCLLGCSWVF